MEDVLDVYEHLYDGPGVWPLYGPDPFTDPFTLRPVASLQKFLQSSSLNAPQPANK